MNNPLVAFVNLFHTAQNGGRSHFEVVRSRRLEPLLELLSREGYLGGYTQRGDRTRVALPPRRGAGRRTRFQLVSIPSKRVYTSLGGLVRRYPKNEFLVISSPQGLLTYQQAFLYQSGGEVLLRAHS